MIDSAAAARTDLTGNFSTTSLKPVSTYVQRPWLLEQLAAQLHSGIENGETDSKCLVVYGLGGAGKSQLVLDYIRQYRQDYSATIWISASSQASIEHDFTQLYRLLYSAITLKDTDLPKIDDIILAVKSWFSGQDGRWLFVFDSADEIGNEEGHALDIEKYMFDLSTTHTIITTRSLVAKDMSTDTPVEVGMMEESEAIDLFNRCAKLRDHTQASEVKLIVQELGCLALAVTLAGFYISQTPQLALNIRDYLPIYRRQRKSLLDQKPRKIVHQYGESVLTTWETSFQSIEKRSPASAQFLMFLACISPDDIDIGLFCGLDDADDADDPGLLWKTLLCLDLDGPVDVYTVQDCLRLLAEYSLIQWEEELGTYVMHQLVHAWGFERLNPQEKQQCTHAMMELLDLWVSASPLNLEIKDRIIPHITANREAVSSILKDVNKHSGEPVFEMIALYRQTMNFLFEMGKYSQTSAWFRACWIWYEASYGPEHPDTITAMNNLALTLSNQGKTDEAASIQQQALEITHRIRGPEHPDTISVMNNLALMLDDQAKWDEAALIQQQVLTLRQQILGHEHADTLMAKNNLAVTLSYQGKIDEAELMQQQVVETMQRILGPEHPDTITVLSNLAHTLSKQAKTDEAMLMEQQVLEMRQRILGPEHPDTITAINNLAHTLSHQGKVEEAVLMQQQVLETIQRILGLEHPDTITAMSNLALTFSRLAKIDEAVLMQQQVLELRQRTLGLGHPGTIAATNSLERMRDLQQRTRE